METTAGNIYAGLPPGIGFDLFATAERITLSDSDSFAGERNQRKLDGRLYGGGTPVRLQTQSGTVTIDIE